ncbi:MAG: cytochrome c nitrite reductase, pentaheme subunit, partial [Verrucomicrobiales bacterium]|nr:cytochrome c nitrite reductase, pentaheme subunit [Verrucomicrobiales bacterium]
PMLPEEVVKAAGDKLPSQSSDDVERDPYNTKPITDQQIQQVLVALASDKTQGEGVFIAAGKLYRLNGDKLRAEENEAAKPYAWALAHDVRPAKQAVGARGCADCHADKSPIYSGTVAARGPVEPKNGVAKEMWEARGDDSKTVASAFAFTFKFRTMLKIVTFSAAFVVLAVLVSYGVAGVGAMTRGGRRKQNNK